MATRMRRRIARRKALLREFEAWFEWWKTCPDASKTDLLLMGLAACVLDDLRLYKGKRR